MKKSKLSRIKERQATLDEIKRLFAESRAEEVPIGVRFRGSMSIADGRNPTENEMMSLLALLDTSIPSGATRYSMPMLDGLVYLINRLFPPDEAQTRIADLIVKHINFMEKNREG